MIPNIQHCFHVFDTGEGPPAVNTGEEDSSVIDVKVKE